MRALPVTSEVLRAALNDAFRIYFDNLFRVLMVDGDFKRFEVGIKKAKEMYEKIEKQYML